MRMNRKSYLFFIGLSLLLACEQPNEQVNWIIYNRGELIKIHNMELKYDGYNFTYGTTDSTGIFTASFEVTFNWDDLSLNLWEVDCEFLDGITIHHDGKSTKVFKFYLDDPESIDEEAWIYVSRDHGLLGIVEFAWSGHQLFVNNNRELLNNLENDTTGFFYKS